MRALEILGGRKLNGKIEIESAKNSVLALLAASILTDECVIIKNCPKIQDVISSIEILKFLGVEVAFQQGNAVINSKFRNNNFVPEKFSKKLRSSIYFMGALCGISGSVKISLPGGCDIGDRPIDLHIASMRELGVKVDIVGNEIICEKIANKDAEIYLKFPSVGATVNIILASALGQNKTVIHNPAKEPEITDLANFINAMGGRVFGAGSSTIQIEGVKKLRGVEYKPIPDRIELGTYLLASAITCGKTEFKNGNYKNIEILVNKILNNSCHIDIKNDIIYGKFDSLGRGRSFVTAPYPGFPTDLQPQTTAYLSVCEGCSRITEQLFEKRFSFASDLNRMGADVRVKNNIALVNGVKSLHGEKVNATDLRSGAALVIAALKAEGKSVIYGVEHIERGYFDIATKLSMLGAEVKLIE